MVAPVPVERIVPALSMTKVPVAVGLRVPAVIRTASVRPWIVAPSLLVSWNDVMLLRLVVFRLMPRAAVDSIRPLLSIAMSPAPGQIASDEVERMMPVEAFSMLMFAFTEVTASKSSA